MNDMDVLNALLRSYDIKHFRAEEVVQLGRRRGGAVITMPPEDIWWRIIPTLRIADALREFVGPIKVLSGYRPEAYNRAVGGAENSMHVQFNALDIRPVSWDQIERSDFLSLVDTEVGDLGGVGLYEDRHPHDEYEAGFAHIDTRWLLFGHVPARWEGLTG